MSLSCQQEEKHWFFFLAGISSWKVHTHTHTLSMQTHPNQSDNILPLCIDFQVLSSESHLIYMKRADDPLWKRCVCV